MIIGITGLLASGKDTVADYLVKERGFKHISLSAILRERAKLAGVPLTRENLISFGTTLKEHEGHNVLAQEAVNRVQNKTIITSIRHPKEVIFLKKIPGFRLIDVNAPAKIRYDRAKIRDRPGDNINSLKEFLALENEERQGGGGQELDKVIKLADYSIDNSRDLQYLYRQTDQLIDRITGFKHANKTELG